jgi:hypothetical protein
LYIVPQAVNDHGVTILPVAHVSGRHASCSGLRGEAPAVFLTARNHDPSVVAWWPRPGFGEMTIQAGAAKRCLMVRPECPSWLLTTSALVLVCASGKHLAHDDFCHLFSIQARTLQRTALITVAPSSVVGGF